MLREMADAFIEQNADKGNVTIEIGVQSESSAKDTVLADPESAADVFAFADDQLNELVNAGALQEVLLNPDDVKSRNLPGSVDAATMNDKLYAYPMTADNGYFLYYDASVLSAEAVQSAPAIAALAEQSSYATLQRGGANYWSSAASLGEILASGDTQGKTTQQLVDDAVAGITAPVAQ